VNPDEAHFALTLRLHERIDGPAAHEMTLRVVVVDALVDLPEIEVVGPEAPKRLFQLPHRLALVAAMGAELGHQEHLIAAIHQRRPHDLFRLSVVIFPRVVHERDTGVDGRMDDADAFALRFRPFKLLRDATCRRMQPPVPTYDLSNTDDRPSS
jgi:hypothetical protein